MFFSGLEGNSIEVESKGDMTSNMYSEEDIEFIKDFRKAFKKHPHYKNKAHKEYFKTSVNTLRRESKNVSEDFIKDYKFFKDSGSLKNLSIVELFAFGRALALPWHWSKIEFINDLEPEAFSWSERIDLFKEVFEETKYSEKDLVDLMCFIIIHNEYPIVLENNIDWDAIAGINPEWAYSSFKTEDGKSSTNVHNFIKFFSNI